jgi:uncharacterized membrane protein
LILTSYQSSGLKKLSKYSFTPYTLTSIILIGVFETFHSLNKTKGELNMNKKVLFLTQAAMIAAIYVVLTLVFAPFSYGEIQVRVSEALTILPFFTPAAIPGLFLGCFFSNLLGGSILLDVIGGSLATLIAAIFSYLLRRHKYLVALPPIVVNILVVPFILYYGYQVNLPVPFMMLTVGIGQIISCGILGNLVLGVLERHKVHIFKQS